MILRIPQVPSAALTENRRRGWQENSGKKQSMKEEFWPLLCEALDSWTHYGNQTPWYTGMVDISYRFHFKDARMRDRDGLAQRLKVIQDLLGSPKGKDISYKLGIIIDDSDKWINRWEILPTVYKAPAEMLEISIEACEDAP